MLLRFFDAAPLRVVFVGGWWAAQVLVCRCLAVGAMVAVDAHDNAASADAVADRSQWLSLGRLGGSSRGRVRPLSPDIDTWPTTAAQPVLRLRDVGPGGPLAVPGQPWHTELAVLAITSLLRLLVAKIRAKIEDFGACALIVEQSAFDH